MNTQLDIFNQPPDPNWRKQLLGLFLAAFLLGAGWLGWQPPAVAILAQGDAVTDPQAILRYSLPIDNKPVRKLQKSLEDISNQLRGKRWRNIGRDITDASFVLSARRDRLLESIPAERQSQAESLIAKLTAGTQELKEIVDNKDREGTYLKRRELLDYVTELEQLMVVGYPFEVPEEYADLPQLFRTCYRCFGN